MARMQAFCKLRASYLSETRPGHVRTRFPSLCAFGFTSVNNYNYDLTLIRNTVKEHRPKYKSLEFKEQQKKLGEDVSGLPSFSPPDVSFATYYS